MVKHTRQRWTQEKILGRGLRKIKIITIWIFLRLIIHSTFENNWSNIFFFLFGREVASTTGKRLESIYGLFLRMLNIYFWMGKNSNSYNTWYVLRISVWYIILQDKVWFILKFISKPNIVYCIYKMFEGALIINISYSNSTYTMFTQKISNYHGKRITPVGFSPPINHC